MNQKEETKEHSIHTLRDVARLTPDEFQRFLPDFIAWQEIAHQAEQVGIAHSTGFQWVDDGNPGVVNQIDITQNGKTYRFELDEEGAT